MNNSGLKHSEKSLEYLHAWGSAFGGRVFQETHIGRHSAFKGSGRMGCWAAYVADEGDQKRITGELLYLEKGEMCRRASWLIELEICCSNMARIEMMEQRIALYEDVLVEC